MDTVHKAQITVSEELGVLRKDLHRQLESYSRQLAHLQRTHEADSQQVADLLSTHETEAKQLAALQRMNDANSTHVDDLLQMQKEDMQQIAELQRILETDAQLIANLDGRMAEIEKENSQARDHIGHIDHSLTDIGQRQDTTETNFNTLETKLDEGNLRYEKSLQTINKTLAGIVDELRSLLSLQTEFTTNIHDAVTRQLEPVQAGHKRSRRPLIILIITTVLIFTGAFMAWNYTMHVLEEGGQKVAMIEGQFSSYYLNLMQQIDSQSILLNELKQTAKKQAKDQQVLLEGKAEHDAVQKQVESLAVRDEIKSSPNIREMQDGLISLGFDLGMTESDGELGIKTRRALQEFRRFYLLQDDPSKDEISLSDENSLSLVSRILNSADLVTLDIARFNIRKDVLAAIRLGSIRTGVDFSFLMEMARAESSFNPNARAPNSTATGLYQFRDNAWLEVIRRFGSGYGLKDYANRLKIIEEVEQGQRPIVRDPLHLEVLSLRLNPRLSTLMLAEHLKRSVSIILDKTGRKPGRTDLYLSHYLGTDSAVRFLTELIDNPDSIAKNIFPEKAAIDKLVFQNRQGRPRTIAEVYKLFDRKFDTGYYDTHDPG